MNNEFENDATSNLSMDYTIPTYKLPEFVDLTSGLAFVHNFDPVGIIAKTQHDNSEKSHVVITTNPNIHVVLHMMYVVDFIQNLDERAKTAKERVRIVCEKRISSIMKIMEMIRDAELDVFTPNLPYEVDGKETESEAFNEAKKSDLLSSQFNETKKDNKPS